VNIILSSILGYYSPQLIKKLYEKVLTDSFYDFSKQLLVFYMVIYFNRCIYQLLVNRYVQKLLESVRFNAFDIWIKSRRKISTNKYPLGEVIARIMNDSNAVVELLSSGAFTIIIDLIFVISCMVSFLLINTKSGILIMSLEILFCIILILLSKKLGEVFLEVRKRSGILSRTIADVTEGIKDLLLYPHNNFAFKYSHKPFDDFLKIQLKANVWDAAVFSLAESLFPIILLFLVIILPYTQMTEIAVLAAVIDLIQRSINPIKSIASKISGIKRAGSGLERMSEFLLDIQKDRMQIMKKSVNGFKDATFYIPSFSYDNESSFSIKPFEFKVKKGDLIAIVGESGSGKSTIFKIINGEIYNDRFRVSLGEESFKSEEFLSHTSLVSQEAHLFSDSIKFNITLGEDERFQEFWNKVQQDLDYFTSWKVDPEDIINVSDLSLGQKQLIISLRALFLTKPIVLFDEIASGLDPVLEKDLRKIILQSRSESLTFVIAHRVETIVHADLILIIKNGELHKKGNHKQLMIESESYRNMFGHLF